MGGIVHDKIGNATFDIKFQYLYNMRMAQVSNSASLSQKIVHILISEAHIQHFDGGKGVEMDVFAQINVGEVTTPQQLDNTVISQLLTHARFREIAFFVFHLQSLLHCLPDLYSAIIADRGNILTVGRPCNCIYLTGMTAISQERVATLGLPDMHAGIG